MDQVVTLTLIQILLESRYIFIKFYSDIVEDVVKLLKKYGLTISVENVLTKLETRLQNFRDKYKITKSEVFKVAPKVLMNLLMTFESYDTQVKNKDMYMPEEKVINFNVGFLKLQFQGTLRITMDRNDTKATKKEDGPSLAYSVVDNTDLVFKVDKPFILKYFYIRPNVEYHKNSSLKAVQFSVIGMKNGVKIFEAKKIANKDSREWVRFVK